MQNFNNLISFLSLPVYWPFEQSSTHSLFILQMHRRLGRRHWLWTETICPQVLLLWKHYSSTMQFHIRIEWGWGIEQQMPLGLLYSLIKSPERFIIFITFKAQSMWFLKYPSSCILKNPRKKTKTMVTLLVFARWSIWVDWLWWLLFSMFFITVSSDL